MEKSVSLTDIDIQTLLEGGEKRYKGRYVFYCGGGVGRGFGGERYE